MPTSRAHLRDLLSVLWLAAPAAARKFATKPAERPTGSTMNNGNGNGNGVGNGSLDDRFLGVIHAMPLGRLAEHRCNSLVAARLHHEPITSAIMIDYLETLGNVMRESQYVRPNEELAMEFEAALPLLQRLAAAVKKESA